MMVCADFSWHRTSSHFLDTKNILYRGNLLNDGMKYIYQNTGHTFACYCQYVLRDPYIMSFESAQPAKVQRFIFKKCFIFNMEWFIVCSGQIATQRLQLVPRQCWLSILANLLPSLSMIITASSGHSFSHL